MTNKKFMSLILASTLLASTTSVGIVKADTISVDAIYTNAYEATAAALNSKTQESINAAMDAIKLLPKDLNWAIGELSKQVDKIQQPILEKAYNAILAAEKTPTQANFNAAKAAIDQAMPEFYRNSYSSAVDELQQQYMKKAVDSFNKANESKLQSDVDAANAIFEDIRTSANPSIAAWVDIVQGMGDLKDLSDGGTHTGNYVIASDTGTFGPADAAKPTSIKGNIIITNAKGSSVTLQNISIDGILSVNFGDGNVALNNVKVKGVTVTNVGPHTLFAGGSTTIGSINFQDENNNGRILLGDNASVTNTNVLSGGRLEVAVNEVNPNPFGAVRLGPPAPPVPQAPPAPTLPRPEPPTEPSSPTPIPPTPLPGSPTGPSSPTPIPPTPLPGSPTGPSSQTPVPPSVPAPPTGPSSQTPVPPPVPTPPSLPSPQVPQAPPSPLSTVTLAGTFDNILVNMPAIVDVPGGSVVNNITANSNMNLSGSGAVNILSVGGPGAVVDIQAPSVGTVTVTGNASGAAVNIGPNTAVKTLNISAPAAITGTGTVTAANIGASGTTLQMGPGSLSVLPGVTATVGGLFRNDSNSTVIPRIPANTPPPPEPEPSYTQPIVYVKSIAVTAAGNVGTIYNGGTLQMSAAILPVNAIYKTIVWTVSTLSGGTATINSSTGLLTATGIGTVTVTASDPISRTKGSKVITITPKETIELAQELTGGSNVTSTLNGYALTIAGKIPYAKEGGTLNLVDSGNWTGVRIAAPAGVIPDENAVLTVDGDLKGTGWVNIKESGSLVNSFHLYFRVTDIAMEYNITIKWNNQVTETYLVKFATTTTLEVYKTDLQSIIANAQQAYNDTAQDAKVTAEARTALSSAITAAQTVYDNAVTSTTEAVQNNIDEARYTLQNAVDAFWNAYPTEISAASSNMVASTIYTDAAPLLIALNINGAGDFFTDITNYITFGGSLSGMTIKTINFETNDNGKAIAASLELTGTLGDSIDTKTITLAPGSVNGHSHGFDVVWQ